VPEGASLNRIRNSNTFKNFLKSNVKNWHYHLLKSNLSLKHSDMAVIHSIVSAPHYVMAALVPAGKSRASTQQPCTLSLDAAGTVTILADPSMVHIRSKLAEQYQHIEKALCSAIFISFYSFKASTTKNIAPQSEKRLERCSPMNAFVSKQEGNEDVRTTKVPFL
jgi:hypothetical protein